MCQGDKYLAQRTLESAAEESTGEVSNASSGWLLSSTGSTSRLGAAHHATEAAEAAESGDSTEETAEGVVGAAHEATEARAVGAVGLGWARVTFTHASATLNTGQTEDLSEEVFRLLGSAGRRGGCRGVSGGGTRGLALGGVEHAGETTEAAKAAKAGDAGERVLAGSQGGGGGNGAEGKEDNSGEAHGE